MFELKYGIVMGVCIIIGGMFSIDFYSIVWGVDKLIFVDVYLLGCLFKLEVVIDVIIKFCKKIVREIYKDWIRF